MAEPVIAELEGGPTPEEIAGAADALQAPSGPSQEEFKTVLSRLEAAEKRIEGQTKSYNQEHWLRQKAEADAEAFRRVLAEQQQLAQRAAAVQEPQIDWEGAVEGGDKLKQAFTAYGNYLATQMYHYTQPAVESYQSVAQRLEGMQGQTIRTALSEARNEWTSGGYDPDTYDEVATELRQHFQSNPQMFQQATMSDDGIVGLAMVLARRKGLPIPVSRSESPPVTSSGSPSAGGVQTPAELNAMARRVQRTLGLESFDLDDTERESLNEAFEGKNPWI